MKKTLVSVVAALVVSQSIALANPAAPAAAPAAAGTLPGPVVPAAPLPPAANGMNEAPAHPNWQNLDATSGVEKDKPVRKQAKARKHAKSKSKKAKKAKKARKSRHQRRHH